MKKKLLYLLMLSLLPVILQGGEGAKKNLAICGPIFGGLSPISSASSSADVLRAALEKFDQSSQSGSSSVGSGIEAYDLLGKKRLRSLSSLSQDRFLDIGSSEHGYASGDEVSVGNFSDDEPELVNGSIPLDLDEVLHLKEHGCDLTGDENIKYELQGWTPPYSDCSKKRDEFKSQRLQKAKDLLEEAKANVSNAVPLTSLITHLRNNPNLTKWHDKSYCTLANYLVELVCKEDSQSVDCAFLDQILNRTRSSNSGSANPVFRKLHAVADFIKKETQEQSCEFCGSILPGNCDFCPTRPTRWHMKRIINRANEIFFEMPDQQVLSQRKCKAATELVTAIEHNDVDQVDKLMAANPKVPFYCDAKRYFSIQHAAKFNRPDLIAKFEAAGLDKDQSYDGMMTPLQLAVVHGNLESVQKLLELGACPNRGIYVGNKIDRPTPTAYMTARTLAGVLARGNQPNAKRICLELQQRQ